MSWSGVCFATLCDALMDLYFLSYLFSKAKCCNCYRSHYPVLRNNKRCNTYAKVEVRKGGSVTRGLSADLEIALQLWL